MIGVVEEAEVQTLESLVELHGSLVGLYGRVLRIRSIERQIDYGSIYGDYDYGRSRDIWEKSDRLGRLIGLELTEQRERFKEEKRTEASNGPYLRLKLQGSEGYLNPELNLSLIEVLQEDTGVWTIIHRAANWQRNNEVLEFAS